MERTARDINPLYVDGPLKGGEFKPVRLGSGVCAMDGESTVMYHFHRFTILGRVIWIGAIRPVEEISEADLFDLIISDRAKQASDLAS